VDSNILLGQSDKVVVKTIAQGLGISVLTSCKTPLLFNEEFEVFIKFYEDAKIFKFFKGGILV